MKKLFIVNFRLGKLPANKRRRNIKEKRRRKSSSGKRRSGSVSWRSRKLFLRRQRSV